MTLTINDAQYNNTQLNDIQNNDTHRNYILIATLNIKCVYAERRICIATQRVVLLNVFKLIVVAPKFLLIAVFYGGLLKD